LKTKLVHFHPNLLQSRRGIEVPKVTLNRSNFPSVVADNVEVVDVVVAMVSTEAVLVMPLVVDD
jgi:hypothetical protein